MPSLFPLFISSGSGGSGSPVYLTGGIDVDMVLRESAIDVQLADFPVEFRLDEIAVDIDDDAPPAEVRLDEVTVGP